MTIVEDILEKEILQIGPEKVFRYILALEYLFAKKYPMLVFNLNLKHLYELDISKAKELSRKNLPEKLTPDEIIKESPDLNSLYQLRETIDDIISSLTEANT